ncbi:hypothetical protein POVCU2_0083920 [Plasmodium ovale curtisi]|uniref:Uncharacterized protein n=1 Tax=Plasmodium ovale curtisi TaxID=864141 RepID=A0A1A8WR97_PLAOA|nr:hypothetical protein POVCU1_022920 [Plasmodium ovale curtisi]SBS93839.1 hypothetical protein POVCU2_0083920 [Plasmodium ovale curtisi]
MSDLFFPIMLSRHDMGILPNIPKDGFLIYSVDGIIITHYTLYTLPWLDDRRNDFCHACLFDGKNEYCKRG